MAAVFPAQPEPRITTSKTLLIAEKGSSGDKPPRNQSTLTRACTRTERLATYTRPFPVSTPPGSKSTAGQTQRRREERPPQPLSNRDVPLAGVLLTVHPLRC